MAKSLIVKNHPISLPAPLSEILTARLHSEDGGQKFELQFRLAEGLEPEILQSLLTKLVESVKAHDQALKQSKVKARQAKEAAKKAEEARVLAQLQAEEAERARQQRKADFLAAKSTPLNAPFDPSSMWATTDAEHALQVAMNIPQLHCAGYFETETYVPGAGHVPQRAFAFFDPQHLSERVCPRCGQATVITTVSQSSGRVHKHCSRSGCKFFENKLPEPAHSYVRAAMHPLQAR